MSDIAKLTIGMGGGFVLALPIVVYALAARGMHRDDWIEAGTFIGGCYLAMYLVLLALVAAA